MKRVEAGFGSTQTHMFLLPRTIACFQHGALFASRTELRQCLTASMLPLVVPLVVSTKRTAWHANMQIACRASWEAKSGRAQAGSGS